MHIILCYKKSVVMQLCRNRRQSSTWSSFGLSSYFAWKAW